MLAYGAQACGVLIDVQAQAFMTADQSAVNGIDFS
jgi:hypothetical protein